MNDQTDHAFNSKSDERFSANCPARVELRLNDSEDILTISGFIVNLSVSGCLVSSNRLPWCSMGGGQPSMSAVDVVGRICRIHLPWTKLHCAGTVRRVGSFIMGIEFHQKLQLVLVRKIARQEPGRSRLIGPDMEKRRIRTKTAATQSHG
jgi:hypothetical protein